MYNSQYSIYVHIPFCKARCGYCAFSSCTDYAFAQRYFARLTEEISHFADKSRPIYTLYIGGGTPSSVPIEYLSALFDALDGSFDMSGVVESTVECNPESVSAELLSLLRRRGVNRLSFGLQSANNDTLRRIGRLHSYEQFLHALELARAQGFDNINADLILGLPEQRTDFVRSVSAVAQLPLTHISVYALELHEGTPMYKCGSAFSDDELADMYDEATSVLGRQGFDRYEISNFAVGGREALHNLHYWQEGRYLAFGASASGFVGDFRYTNPWSIGDYLAAPVEQLHTDGQHVPTDEQAREFVMLGLRLTGGISREEFRRSYNADFFKFFPKADDLLRGGFLAECGDRIFVPADKIYVLNFILCELFD